MATTDEVPATLALPPEARSTHDTAVQGRYYLTLGLTEQMYDRVENLAMLLEHQDKAAVINKAVGLLKWATDAAAQGKRVCIVDDKGEIEDEIVGFFGR